MLSKKLANLENGYFFQQSPNEGEKKENKM